MNAIATLGQLALILAWGCSGIAIAAALWGGRTGSPTWVASARRAVIATFPLVLFACLMIWTGLLTNDFSIKYVADVSSIEMPTYLKVTALWGGQAGSLLFWNLIQTGFSAMAMVRYEKRFRPLLPLVIALLSVTQFFFLFVSVVLENPFKLNAVVPLDGRGLNPLLRHPGMIIHPPMLYLGFIGFTIPYAYAMAALIKGELDEGWIEATRGWTITAWLFLSLGLLLGGRWAYDVLGWGGYWAWDPVENASFMPWLSGTAFLHSVMIQQKRGMFKLWNLSLVIMTYCLVILGTFVVRSGVISSVHAFAQSSIGPFFFGFISLMLIFSVFWVQKRRETLTDAPQLRSLMSREAAFLLNNFLILSILAIVFLFTYFPIFSELFVDEKVFVGPPVYEKALGPLFAALLVLMGIAPLMMWARTDLKKLGMSLRIPLLIVAAGEIALFASGVRIWPAFVGFGVVTFSAVLTLLEFWKGIRARMKRSRRPGNTPESPLIAMIRLFRRQKQRYGGYLIHLGVVLIGFGIIGTELFQLTRQIQLTAGESVTLGDFEMVFNGAKSTPGIDDLQVIEASVDVYRDGRFVQSLTPHINVYQRSGQTMTIPAVRSTLTEDFYVLLIHWEPASAVAASFRLYVNPLINLVWLGGLVFVLGTLVAIWPERRWVQDPLFQPGTPVPNPAGD